jgi:Family of unknown function (DUF6228)
LDDESFLQAGGPFEIRSSERGARLLLRRYQGGLIAELNASGLSSATQVYLLGGCDHLDQFWRDLAENWRGWEGTRSWQSLEGDLEFSATSDRLGHVELEVRMEEGAPFQWRVHGKISLDAGQLDHIAAAARTFCA